MSDSILAKLITVNDLISKICLITLEDSVDLVPWIKHNVEWMQGCLSENGNKMLDKVSNMLFFENQIKNK